MLCSFGDMLRVPGSRGDLLSLKAQGAAYASPDDRGRALSAGLQNHVAKPIDPARRAGAIARLRATANRSRGPGFPA